LDGETLTRATPTDARKDDIEITIVYHKVNKNDKIF